MQLGPRDPLSGYRTTGHDWNGITELNTPVPRIVIFFLVVTTLYAVIGWILLPAWPLGATFTKGLWGADQRRAADAVHATIAARRAPWESEILSKDFAAIRADPALMARIDATAPTLFGENCQPCHGAQGRGGPGFPRLDGAARVWGDDAEAMAETIRVGVNSAHPDSRVAQMPAFGKDGVLKRPDIERLVAHVTALSKGEKGSPEGRKLFADNCAACHGENARGVAGTGAPDLTDSDWLYGGDPAALFATLQNGRRGEMPTWEQRLSKADIRILALYVEKLARAAK